MNNNNNSELLEASFNILSGRSSFSKMISEKKSKLPANIQQMVADHDQKADALTDIFYVYQNKIDEIQKKAREEVSKLKKEQSEKSTKLSLKLFDDFSKKMSDLGYKFSGNMDVNPDGPWVEK